MKAGFSRIIRAVSSISLLAGCASWAAGDGAKAPRSRPWSFGRQMVGGKLSSLRFFTPDGKLAWTVLFDEGKFNGTVHADKGAAPVPINKQDLRDVASLSHESLFRSLMAAERKLEPGEGKAMEQEYASIGRCRVFGKISQKDGVRDRSIYLAVGSERREVGEESGEHGDMDSMLRKAAQEFKAAVAKGECHMELVQGGPPRFYQSRLSMASRSGSLRPSAARVEAGKGSRLLNLLQGSGQR